MAVSVKGGTQHARCHGPYQHLLVLVLLGPHLGPHPVNDRSMLVAVHGSYFPGPIYRITLGDDIWHIMDRVFVHHRGLIYVPLRSSLLHVLQKIVVAAQVRALRIGVDWVAALSEKGALGTGPALPLSVGEWQRLCVERTQRDLDAWLLDAQQGPYAHLLGEAAHQLALAKQRLQYLFSFIEHARELGVRGTTPNEHGHQGLNNRTQNVSHMRSDHLAHLLMYAAHLANGVSAKAAAANVHLPQSVRERCAGLFPLTASVPLDAAGAEGRCPYIIPYRRPVRVYTQPEFDAQFGMHGGIVM